MNDNHNFTSYSPDAFHVVPSLVVGLGDLCGRINDSVCIWWYETNSHNGVLTRIRYWLCIVRLLCKHVRSLRGNNKSFVKKEYRKLSRPDYFFSSVWHSRDEISQCQRRPSTTQSDNKIRTCHWITLFEMSRVVRLNGAVERACIC